MSLDVVLGSFRRVVGRVGLVTLRYMSVVGGGLMIAGFMMLGSFLVVVSGMLVMLSCLGMMMRCFLRHEFSFRLRDSETSFGWRALSEEMIAERLRSDEILVNPAALS